MNERFKELFIQVRNESENMRWNIEDAETFAELIVGECAEVAGCNGHVSGFALGDLIKQHFGVEE